MAAIVCPYDRHLFVGIREFGSIGMDGLVSHSNNLRLSVGEQRESEVGKGCSISSRIGNRSSNLFTEALIGLGVGIVGHQTVVELFEELFIESVTSHTRLTSIEHSGVSVGDVALTIATTCGASGFANSRSIELHVTVDADEWWSGGVLWREWTSAAIDSWHVSGMGGDSAPAHLVVVAASHIEKQRSSPTMDVVVA